MATKNKRKRKQQAQAMRRRQWEREDQEIKRLRARAPYLKILLRGRGCVLPFYDFLDSYSEEFKRIVDGARNEYPSLLGIHEVDDDTFYGADRDWSQFGYDDLEQILFDEEEDVPDYATRDTNANMCGAMSALFDADQNVRTVILIRKTVKISFRHHEYKYAFKIASLFHELGHVEDLENGINFDVALKRVDLIQAEVYAQLHCLKHLACRNLRQSFTLTADALRNAIPRGGYLATVAQQVIERMPQYDVADWNSVLDEEPTHEELMKLGPKGVEAMTT